MKEKKHLKFWKSGISDAFILLFLFTKCPSVDIINIGEFVVNRIFMPIRPRDEQDRGNVFSLKI